MFFAFLFNTCNTRVNKLLDAEKFQIRTDSRVVRAHLIVSQIAWKDPAFMECENSLHLAPKPVSRTNDGPSSSPRHVFL